MTPQPCGGLWYFSTLPGRKLLRGTVVLHAGGSGAVLCEYCTLPSHSHK
jgi:hypothetical protein